MAFPAVDQEDLETTLSDVRARIAEAAERADRDPADVEILPVTKGHRPDVLRVVARAGFRMVGENRVSEAEEKFSKVGNLGLRWHMVGHLQRNKARRGLKLFDELESLDSLRLGRKLNRELEKADGGGLDCLVQVNSSGEDAKGGFDATDPGSAELMDGLRTVCSFPRLRVRGMMTMAPLTDDEEVLRTTFRRTRRAWEAAGQEVKGFEAEVLSMGMSHDYEIAVEEGSTRLRLGTALFGERSR